jgi:hypothetical protein
MRGSWSLFFGDQPAETAALTKFAFSVHPCPD